MCALVSDRHGDVEEEREQRLIVYGPTDKAALIEFGRRLTYHYTQANPPEQQAELSYNNQQR